MKRIVTNGERAWLVLGRDPESPRLWRVVNLNEDTLVRLACLPGYREEPA